jgi:hypothetical protein
MALSFAWPGESSKEPLVRARGELFALGVLMLRTMQGSAGIGYQTHGGPAWKAFGRALIEEQAARTSGA